MKGSVATVFVSARKAEKTYSNQRCGNEREWQRKDRERAEKGQLLCTHHWPGAAWPRIAELEVRKAKALF